MRTAFPLLFSFCLSSVFGQAPDFGGKAQIAALDKASFMLGSWKGSGWASIGSEKHEFQGTEVIERRCGGALFSLDGNHFITVGDRKIPIHVAFGFLRFDDKKGGYFMRSHLSNGLEMEYPITITANGYTWEQDSPNWGHVVYTATFSGGSWTEYGETEKDGKKTRVYEMTMRKQKA
jgi:hypothetical protein